MTIQRRWDIGVRALLPCAVIGVLVQNWLLTRQVNWLSDELTLRGRVVAGKRVRDLGGLGLDGKFKTAAFPPVGTNLLVMTFSPGCPACIANQRGWVELARRLEGRGWSVLWLSRDSVEVTRNYCLRENIPASLVLADPPYRTYLQFGLARVPNTVAIGPDGSILRAWPGQLDADGWGRLFAYFGAGEARPAAATPNGGVRAQFGCEPGTVPALTKTCR